MIEPSRVVTTKKKGDQWSFCCTFRYLNSVTAKDEYHIPRINESLSKLRDANFLQHLIWGRIFGRYHIGNKREIKRGLFVSQFYKERKGLLCHTTDGVLTCKRRDEEKLLREQNLIILPQLYRRCCSGLTMKWDVKESVTKKI